MKMMMFIILLVLAGVFLPASSDNCSEMGGTCTQTNQCKKNDRCPSGSCPESGEICCKCRNTEKGCEFWGGTCRTGSQCLTSESTCGKCIPGRVCCCPRLMPGGLTGCGIRGLCVPKNHCKKPDVQNTTRCGKNVCCEDIGFCYKLGGRCIPKELCSPKDRCRDGSCYGREDLVCCNCMNKEKNCEYWGGTCRTGGQCPSGEHTCGKCNPGQGRVCCCPNGPTSPGLIGCGIRGLCIADKHCKTPDVAPTYCPKKTVCCEERATCYALGGYCTPTQLCRPKDRCLLGFCPKQEVGVVCCKCKNTVSNCEFWGGTCRNAGQCLGDEKKCGKCTPGRGRICCCKS